MAGRNEVAHGKASEECEYAAACRGLGTEGDDDFAAALLGLGAPRRQSRPKKTQRSRWRLVECLTSSAWPDHERRSAEFSTSPGVTPISMRMLREIDQRLRIPANADARRIDEGSTSKAALIITECPCAVDPSRRERLEDGVTATSSCASGASTPRFGPLDAPASAKEDCAELPLHCVKEDCAQHPLTADGQVASWTSILGDPSRSAWNPEHQLRSRLNSSSRTSSSSSSRSSTLIPRQAHIKPPRHIALILSVSLTQEAGCGVP